jgi:hypothetical protein
LGGLISEIIASPLRVFINKEVLEILDSANGTCKIPLEPIIPPFPPETVNLMNKNPIVHLLDYILDDVVGTDGPLNLNWLVNNATNDTGNFFSDVNMDEVRGLTLV